MRRYFDNTMLKDYKECPRRYFLRHIKKWRREGIAPALVFGLSWHSAMDVIWSHYGKLEDSELIDQAAVAFNTCWVEQGLPAPEDMGVEEIERFAPRTPMVAREMLYGYLEARRHILQQASLVAVEQPFAVPLPIPSPQPRETWYCGRLDKVFDYNGTRILGEHKTTTEYKIDGGFKSQFLQSWYIDSQVLGYLFGGALFFPGLEQVWVDASLVHKKVHDAFKFIPVTCQWSMLEQWVGDTVEWAKRIYADEDRFTATGRLVEGIFPKQTESCFSKYGSCPFLDICRTVPDPSELEEPPMGFIEEEWSPFSVLKLHKLLETS